MNTLAKSGSLVAVVKAVESKAPGGAGEFEAVISTDALDRDGEVLDPGWWEPLPAEIPIHIDHRMFDIRAVVARAVPYAEDGVLKVKGRYASTPDAQMVRTLVAEGMVVTMSVGYHNAVYEDVDGVPHLKSAELLEASFVSVPANTEALVTMAKAATVGLPAEMMAERTKALAGSVEESQERLREALRVVHPSARWLWLRGTFPDEGRVVYEVEVETVDDGYDSTIYQVAFGVDDAGAYTFETPEEVDLAEVVVPAVPDPTVEIPAAGAAKAAPAASGSAMAKATAAVAEAELLLID